MITNEVEKIAVIEVFIVSGALVLIILLLMIGVVTTNAIQKGVVRPKLRKQKVEPQLAGPMPGVCQCGDALCYHPGAGKCELDNCPCGMYVASDLDPRTVEAMGEAVVTRLALAAVNLESELLSKQRAITNPPASPPKRGTTKSSDDDRRQWQ